jgi:mannosyltransferase OCH1-like enzyme
MIPKIIWQTYKTKLPPAISISSIKTWIEKNPDYTLYYFDDEKCERFICDHFSQEFVNMYRSLPFGVMKSDAWRIAIVYIYGGIYTDLDTDCLKPADEWLKDYSFVAAEETPEGTVANFTFAAESKHPILYSCLEQLLENYNCENYLNKVAKTETPIQNYGAHAFHAGVKKYCDQNGDSDKIKIYKFHDNAFTPFPSDKTFVNHLVGSISWSNGYDSWRKIQKRHFNVGY